MTELEPTIVKKYKYYSLEYLLHYLNEDLNENSKKFLKNLEEIEKLEKLEKKDSHSREYWNLNYINGNLYHLSRKIKEKKRMVEKAIEKVKIIIKEEIYIHHFYHYIYEKEKNIINDYNIRIAIHQIEEKYKYTKYNDFYILDNVYNTGNNKYIILIYSKLTFSSFDYFIIKNDDIYRYSNINELEPNDTGISYYIDKKEIKEKIFLLSDPIRNIKLKLNYEIIEEIEQLDIKKHNIENIIRRIQNGEYIDK